MFDVLDDRTGIVRPGAVSFPGSAEVGWDIERANRFQVIPVQPEQDVPVSAQPTGFKAEDCRIAGIQIRRQALPETIGQVVSTACRHDVQPYGETMKSEPGIVQYD